MAPAPIRNGHRLTRAKWDLAGLGSSRIATNIRRGSIQYSVIRLLSSDVAQSPLFVVSLTWRDLLAVVCFITDKRSLQTRSVTKYVWRCWCHGHPEIQEITLKLWLSLMHGPDFTCLLVLPG